jgi:hypothetical protein
MGTRHPSNPIFVDFLAKSIKFSGNWLNSAKFDRLFLKTGSDQFHIFSPEIGEFNHEHVTYIIK